MNQKKREPKDSLLLAMDELCEEVCITVVVAIVFEVVIAVPTNSLVTVEVGGV